MEAAAAGDREDEEIDGIRDRSSRGVSVYLFYLSNGVVGGFMCKKDVSPLDGHLTHHDSRLHNCTDGLIAPKSLPK